MGDDPAEVPDQQPQHLIFLAGQVQFLAAARHDPPVEVDRQLAASDELRRAPALPALEKNERHDIDVVIDRRPSPIGAQAVTDAEFVRDHPSDGSRRLDLLAQVADDDAEILDRRIDFATPGGVEHPVVSHDAADMARERGLSIPGDLSLISFDDTPIARFAQPPLTAVVQPIAAVAAKAVEWIIADQVAGPTPAGPASVPATLVIRGSTAAPHPSARKR